MAERRQRRADLTSVIRAVVQRLCEPNADRSVRLESVVVTIIVTKYESRDAGFLDRWVKAGKWRIFIRDQFPCKFFCHDLNVLR